VCEREYDSWQAFKAKDECDGAVLGDLEDD